MILESILASLMPAIIDGGKQLITKFVGGPQPQNIDDQIKLDNAQVSKLEALAKLDNPYGTPSQWVIDLRASFRYIAAAGIIGAGITSLFLPSLPDELRSTALELASVAFSFIFGDRVYLNLKGRK